MKGIHICRFDTTGHLRGKKRTYESIKEAALAAGRFSTFEASENQQSARWFTQLMRDPDVEKVEMPYPWIGVRRRPRVSRSELSQADAAVARGLREG